MIQSFSPPKVVQQQSATALLLYQDQTVSFRPQRLRIPKKTVNHPFSILRLTYCAARWQSTSWLCYCLIKIRTRSPGNHHTIGITAHVECTEHTRVCKTSCLPGVQLPGVPILRKEILPNTIFSVKLSVEMQRVLLYYRKIIFYWRKLLL